MLYSKRIMNVIGTSTRVSAIASTNGWYIAALWWRRMIGLMAKREGISDIAKSAGRNTALQTSLDKQGEGGKD